MFLTLTVKNCAIADLRSTLSYMNLAFKRLTDLKSWPAIGWVKSVEVTRSEVGEAHPHLHVLMLVPPGYFTGKGYIKQETWRETWQRCLRSDYLPVVNVKSVRAKNAPPSAEKEGTDSAITKAICETLKYTVKEADLVADADWLNQLTTQLHKTRAVAIGGILKGYMKDERDDDDLIHLDENGITVDDEKDTSVWFGWKEAISHYVKVER
jgi:plasmid rolling circle replication initiator protein Rep